eukprot:5291410-Prymnesium_polylepis.1
MALLDPLLAAPARRARVEVGRRPRRPSPRLPRPPLVREMQLVGQRPRERRHRCGRRRRHHIRHVAVRAQEARALGLDDRAQSCSSPAPPSAASAPPAPPSLAGAHWSHVGSRRSPILGLRPRRRVRRRRVPSALLLATSSWAHLYVPTAHPVGKKFRAHGLPARHIRQQCSPGWPLYVDVHGRRGFATG